MRGWGIFGLEWAAMNFKIRIFMLLMVLGVFGCREGVVTPTAVSPTTIPSTETPTGSTVFLPFTSEAVATPQLAPMETTPIETTSIAFPHAHTCLS